MGKVAAVAAADAGLAAGRRALGLQSGGLRAAVAVVRRSRRTLKGRPVVGMTWPDWSFGKFAMVRIGMRAASSGAKIGGAEAAFEMDAEVAVLRVVAVVGTVVAAVPEVDRPVLDSGRAFRVAAGRTLATFCSCPGKARDTPLGLAEAAGILHSHLVAVEEAVHNGQTGVHFLSSSFPCHLEDSSAQQRCWGTCSSDLVHQIGWNGRYCSASLPTCGRSSVRQWQAWSANQEGCRACSSSRHMYVQVWASTHRYSRTALVFEAPEEWYLAVGAVVCLPR